MCAFVDIGMVRNEARSLLYDWYTELKDERGGECGMDVFYPVDLRGIIKEVLGWTLEEVESLGYSADLRDERHGVCDHEGQTIYVATKPLREGRKGQYRYSLAHEIGHARMHAGCMPRVRSGRGGKPTQRLPNPRREREAEVFAAEVLMPEKAVREHFERVFQRRRAASNSRQIREVVPEKTVEDSTELIGFYASKHRGKSDKSLAEYFDVSPTAMGYRIFELGLIF